MCLNDRYVRPWNTRKRALARFRCRRCAIYRAKRHVATGFCVSLRCTWSDGMSPEGRVGWHSEPVGAPAPHELHGWERFLCGGCTHRCRTAPRHRLRCNPEHGVTPGADTSGSLTHVTLSCVESTDISAPGTREPPTSAGSGVNVPDISVETARGEGSRVTVPDVSAPWVTDCRRNAELGGIPQPREQNRTQPPVPANS